MIVPLLLKLNAKIMKTTIMVRNIVPDESYSYIDSLFEVDMKEGGRVAMTVPFCHSIILVTLK